MKKEKFLNLKFDSIETLSKEEMKKVRGGYGTCTTSTGQGFAAYNNDDAQETVLLICGPCNYSCSWS